MGVESVTGKNDRYASIKPGHWAAWCVGYEVFTESAFEVLRATVVVNKNVVNETKSFLKVSSKGFFVASQEHICLQ